MTFWSACHIKISVPLSIISFLLNYFHCLSQFCPSSLGLLFPFCFPDRYVPFIQKSPTIQTELVNSHMLVRRGAFSGVLVKLLMEVMGFGFCTLRLDLFMSLVLDSTGPPDNSGAQAITCFKVLF